MTNGNGWQRILITALLSIVLTGGGAWVAWGRYAVSRAEVVEMIRVDDPYLVDRESVRQLKVSVDQLTLRVQGQGEQLARTVAILERVERQLDLRGSRSP